MKFPNAHKGVKLIFVAELISIVVSVVALIASIFAAAVIRGNGGLAASSATLLLISGFASIVVFVIQLVGIFKGASECSEFRIALWIILVGLVVTLTSAILQSIEATKGLSPILFAVLATVSTLADFFVILCILFGISSLAEKLGYSEMEEKGRRLAFYIIFIYAICLILGFIPGFSYAVHPGWGFVFSIFGVVAVALEIIIYVNTVIYLSRAVSMLEE